MAIDWTPELIETICDRIIAGDSVRQICKDSGMPSEPSFYRKMMSDEEFERTIARARAMAEDAEVDYMIDLADSATPEDFNVKKLQIWARQWKAGKRAPKKYGDRLTQEITGADGGPLHTKQDITPDMEAQILRIAALQQGITPPPSREEPND